MYGFSFFYQPNLTNILYSPGSFVVFNKSKLEIPHNFLLINFFYFKIGYFCLTKIKLD